MQVAYSYRSDSTAKEMYDPLTSKLMFWEFSEDAYHLTLEQIETCICYLPPKGCL
jgi:hypothetical protein